MKQNNLKQTNASTTKGLNKNIKLKDTNIPYLGKIPEHWEVKKVKNLFYIGRGRVISKEELKDDGIYPVYSSQTKQNGILGYIKTYDFDCEQITWTTDGINAGTIFLRKGKHNCTNVCGILQPKNKNENMKFFSYALANVTPHYKRPDTNGAKIMNNEMADISIVYPPLSEQKAIAEFLDDKCKKIENLIPKKEKLIELLKEKKQSLINASTTKGLNKNIKLKDTNIPYLGKIPEHWEVVKLKYIAMLYTGNSIKDSEKNKYKIIDNAIPYISTKDIQRDTCIVNYNNGMYIPKDNKNFRIAPKNSMLICIEGGSAGKKIAFLNQQVCFVNKLCCIKMIKPQDNQKLLFYFMQSNIFQNEFFANIEGLIGGVTAKQIGDFKIPLPPLYEQKAIAEFLDDKCKKIENIIEKLQSQIKLIKEYKSSLINEATSGRKPFSYDK